ncbi:MAG: hypothetical protein QW751_03155 [Candidatus Aenigmatarchaeota archaeon]|nr:hypothetical protein [Candidatus Aenigmarchaeota archaeon]
MKKILLALIIGLFIGVAIGATTVKMFIPAPEANDTTVTGAFLANTESPEVKPLQFSEAFLSDVPVVDSAKCEKNPYAALRYKYTYLCQLFYKTPIEIRKVDTTGSMWPNLKGGGYVIISAPENLKVGDIVILNSTVYGYEVVHRIIETGTDSLGTWYKTRGDNNVIEDSRILRSSDITYKVVGIIY